MLEGYSQSHYIVWCYGPLHAWMCTDSHSPNWKTFPRSIANYVLTSTSPSHSTCGTPKPWLLPHIHHCTQCTHAHSPPTVTAHPTTGYMSPAPNSLITYTLHIRTPPIRFKAIIITCTLHPHTYTLYTPPIRYKALSIIRMCIFNLDCIHTCCFKPQT